MLPTLELVMGRVTERPNRLDARFLLMAWFRVTRSIYYNDQAT